MSEDDGQGRPEGGPEGGPRINVATLKIRELRAIEEKVGHRIAAEISAFDLSMDTVQGLLWIALRRTNPQATFEEAGDLELQDLLEGISAPEEYEQVPPPLGEPPSSPSSNGSPSAEPPSPAGPPTTATAPSSVRGSP